MVASRAEDLAIERVDIAVYSRDDELQLVVEVKNKTHATAAWAANMRRNLAVHLAIPNSPFFLLALPDHFFLWQNAPSATEAILPGYDVDPVPLLAAYISDAQHTLSSISESGLAMAVSSWLTNLVTSTLHKTKAQTDQVWLFDTGLYQAIKGGVVKSQVTL